MLRSSSGRVCWVSDLRWVCERVLRVVSSDMSKMSGTGWVGFALGATLPCASGAVEYMEGEVIAVAACGKLEALLAATTTFTSGSQRAG